MMPFNMYNMLCLVHLTSLRTYELLGLDAGKLRPTEWHSSWFHQESDPLQSSDQPKNKLILAKRGVFA